MKRLLLAVLLPLISFHAYSLEINLMGDTAVYYDPLFFGGFNNSGETYLYQFEESETVNPFYLPIEAKKMLFRFGNTDHILAGNGGVSFYFENTGLSSINATLGIGWVSGTDEQRLRPLNGVYMNLYPLYDFSFGKTPLFPWKIALDGGLAWDLLPVAPVYMAVYLRTIAFFPRDVSFVGAGPPFIYGFSIGLVL